MNSSFIVKAQSVKPESIRETEARPPLFFNDSLTKFCPEIAPRNRILKSRPD